MRRAPLLLLLVLVCWPSAARADQAAPLFDTGRVAAVDITLPPESRAALDKDPGTYQPAKLKVTAPGVPADEFDVTLKLKGHNSFRTLDKKAAFKVKMTKGKPLLGLKKLTLNNMISDPTMVRETLAYKTFRAAGVPAPRTGYAFVRVNGDAYGVYLNLETYDDVSLKQMFPSTSHLYENGFITDMKGDDWKWFEVDEGDEDDRSDLQALTAAAQARGDFSDRMAGKADLTEMVKMWAVEKYIGHWDGYAGQDLDWTPNNYYLHSTTGGLFSMLPWGTDQTWVDTVPFDEGGLLFTQCRDDSSCEDSFRRTLAQVTRIATGLGLQSEVRRLAAMLAPYQQQDTRMEATTNDISWWQDKAVQFMDRRPTDMATYLGDPSLVPGSTPDPPQDPSDPSEPSQPSQSSQGAEPPSPVTPAATPPRAEPAKPLRVGVSRRSGAVISTVVRLPEAGKVSQRMKSGRTTICSVPARRMSAGRHTLRCRLTAGARKRLRRGSLRISQTTRLAGLAPVTARAVLQRCSGC